MSNRVQKAFKEDGQLFVRAFGLLAKIGKIKLDMAKMRRDRESLLKAVGVSIHELYRETRQLDGNAMTQRVGNQLLDIQRLEQEIQNSQQEIARQQADFRQNQMKQPPPQDQQPQQQQQQR